MLSDAPRYIDVPVKDKKKNKNKKTVEGFFRSKLNNQQ